MVLVDPLSIDILIYSTHYVLYQHNNLTLKFHLSHWKNTILHTFFAGQKCISTIFGKPERIELIAYIVL